MRVHIENHQIMYHEGGIIPVYHMSRRAVDAVFQGLFLLCDIRGVLRESAPHHHLNKEQKTRAAKVLEKIEKQVGILREELLK